MNKNILTITLFGLVFFGCYDKQTIIVTPLESNSSKGVADFYENGRKLASYSVMLGRNGIARHGLKREGDGKTPSGEYGITTVFGKYDTVTSKMPYIKTSKNLYCIDDQGSKYYNKLEYSDTIAQDYQSHEDMLRSDGLYDIGAVIDYNKEAIAGLGSCIFLHISSNKPTAGCISLNEKDLKELILLLDSRKNPTIRINP